MAVERNGAWIFASLSIVMISSPLFSLRGKRWKISISSGGIQEHNNS